jgi:hypothetical protein
MRVLCEAAWQLVNGLTNWKPLYVITVVYRGRWNKAYEKDEYVPVNFGKQPFWRRKRS